MSRCSCFLLRLLFLVQEIFDFGLAVQGPRDIGIGCRLSLYGQLFWSLERLFLPKYDILNEHRLQNGAQMGSCWTYFSEKMWKWKSTFGLRRRVRIAYEPIPKSAWCDNKITKNNRCVSSTRFVHQKYKNVWKQISQMCPNGWLYFGGGASWGTCGTIIRNIYPKVLQKWSQDYTNASKRTFKMVQVNLKQWRILENKTSGLADCAKRLQCLSTPRLSRN